MQKLIPVQEAKALMNVGKDWVYGAGSWKRKGPSG